MATFLIIAGVTGSVLAFYRDLDAMLNPELFVVTPPASGAKLLDPIELRDRIKAQLRKDAEVEGVILQLELPIVPSTTGSTSARPSRIHIRAKILGSRKFGDLTEGKKSLLTFIYVFHYSLRAR